MGRKDGMLPHGNVKCQGRYGHLRLGQYELGTAIGQWQQNSLVHQVLVGSQIKLQPLFLVECPAGSVQQAAVGIVLSARDNSERVATIS